MGLQLVSTRTGAAASPLEAVLRGIAPDGGLYMPEKLPRFSAREIKDMAALPYPALAARVIGAFFDEIPPADMLKMCTEAYAGFDAQGVAPLAGLDGDTYALELFHGPTLAFKDVALQLLPRLMAYAAQKTEAAQKVLILVATSGDTGKAALCGFADKEDTAICVFYPEHGVSDAQKLQMQTQTGRNVGVFALKGNFDDCQRGVKALMGDAAFCRALGERGYTLSSANSINFGRLVPQIAYYFSAYAALFAAGRIAFGDTINFAVPTGNFGNILAGWMAKRMGLPVGKLVGASNRNHVLDHFYRTGVYGAGLTLHPTTSPSMDILVSSNLERLLFALCGHDGARVSQWMQRQREGLDFSVGEDVMARMHEDFLWGWADDGEAAQAILANRDANGTILDPHTAVGMHVTREMQRRGALGGPTVLLCTASPYKFAADVLRALGETPTGAAHDVYALAARKGEQPPRAITELFDAAVCHDATLAPQDMAQAVLARLGVIEGE
jgi:threonine synthase